MAAWSGALVITIRRTGGTAVITRTTILTSRPTDTRHGTTHGRARTDVTPAYMVHTAAPASAPAITHGLEPMRAARPHMVLMVRAASPKPTTRELELTPRRARGPTSTAAGARHRCSAATTG